MCAVLMPGAQSVRETQHFVRVFLYRNIDQLRNVENLTTQNSKKNFFQPKKVHVKKKHSHFSQITYCQLRNQTAVQPFSFIVD